MPPWPTAKARGDVDVCVDYVAGFSSSVVTEGTTQILTSAVDARAEMDFDGVKAQLL